MQEQVNGEVEQPIAQEQEVITYPYGDLYIVCKCGGKKLVEAGVQHGRTILVLCDNKHKAHLVCETCGHWIDLAFDPTPEENWPKPEVQDDNTITDTTEAVTEDVPTSTESEVSVSE